MVSGRDADFYEVGTGPQARHGARGRASMGEALLRQPWCPFEFARLLAELHRALGRIPAPTMTL